MEPFQSGSTSSNKDCQQHVADGTGPEVRFVTTGNNFFASGVNFSSAVNLRKLYKDQQFFIKLFGNGWSPLKHFKRAVCRSLYVHNFINDDSGFLILL